MDFEGNLFEIAFSELSRMSGNWLLSNYQLVASCRRVLAALGFLVTHWNGYALVD